MNPSEQKIEEVIARLENNTCCYNSSLGCTNLAIYSVFYEGELRPYYYICKEHLDGYRDFFPRETRFLTLLGEEVARVDEPWWRGGRKTWKGNG